MTFPSPLSRSFSPSHHCTGLKHLMHLRIASQCVHVKTQFYVKIHKTFSSLWEKLWIKILGKGFENTPCMKCTAPRGESRAGRRCAPRFCTNRLQTLATCIWPNPRYPHELTNKVQILFHFPILATISPIYQYTLLDKKVCPRFRELCLKLLWVANWLSMG